VRDAQQVSADREHEERHDERMALLQRLAVSELGRS
jgi:hypothetical protein